MRNFLTIEETRKMFLHISERVIENEVYLNEIDQQIGDGDHGTAMSIGFSEVIEELKNKKLSSINEIFKTIGFALLKVMGGTSGVIFGTLFIGGLKDLEEKESLDLSFLIGLHDKSLNAIKIRGKAKLGDKTMVDALEPAVDALKESQTSGLNLLESIRSAEEGARRGMEMTKEYTSKAGRSKFFGSKSVSIQDAGATSVWIMFRAMREWIENNIV